ncbi:MAG: fibrobacter succinogenes major paralogous domain-containing protein [Bacteroidetes bacterium]|nr:fibrobacter succinogenes major paralogous domain-containing protein [Bacteroidota bacterium]
MKKNQNLIATILVVSLMSVAQIVFAQQEVGVKINGTIWATRNVGIPNKFVSNPEDAGMFYQWNRNVGWSLTVGVINSNGVTIWERSNPQGTEWEKVNDPCPAGWRVPTLDEIRKLLDSNKVSNEMVTQNGIIGRKFTDRVTGKSVFFPAAGYLEPDYGRLGAVGETGNYHSSVQNSASGAYFLRFSNNSIGTNTYHGRSDGCSVRCVAEN